MTNPLNHSAEYMSLVAQQLAEGAYYALPAGLTWQQLSEARKRWDIEPMHAALAVGPGCVAWGRLLAQNYSV